MKKPSQKRITAIHEAGHAVIARALTLACGGASILPNNQLGEAGSSMIGDPYGCTFEWQKRGKIRGSENAIWHGRIMALMAGSEAELILLGSRYEGDGLDREEIELMSRELGCDADQWPKREARLRALTRLMVRKHQHRIVRVADALIKSGKLTSRRIDKLSGMSINDVKVNSPEARRLAAEGFV